MTYNETVEWLFTRLPMFQRIGAAAYKADLDNTIKFCHYLGNPQNSFPCFHIGGTNGKGSTSHMLAAILQKHNFKTGLFTSPHLKDFRERMRVQGIQASEEFVVQFVSKHFDYLQNNTLSFFEMAFGMSMTYFKEMGVDVAVIEVGMGGRLDSTNIVKPEISVITNVSLDHVQFLGNSREAIAKEKAGIIKSKVPIVIGQRHFETDFVFMEFAKRLGSPIYFADDENYLEVFSDLKGAYQKKNIRTVLTTLKHQSFFVPDDNIVLYALTQVGSLTGLRGRWETLSKDPLVICDTAHNEDGILNILPQLIGLNAEKIHFVLGMVDDKDSTQILAHLPKDAEYYFASPNIPRGKPAEKLRNEALKMGLIGEKYDNVSAAIHAAKTNCTENQIVFIGGSTFVVAEAI